MFLEFSDWMIYADLEATKALYAEEATDRCTCCYCKNYRRTVDHHYPDVRYYLSRFGADIDTPESLIPITESLYQASYEVIGRVLRWGSEPIYFGELPVTVEEEPVEGLVILNLAIMELPWVLPQSPKTEDSPAEVIDLFADFK